MPAMQDAECRVRLCAPIQSDVAARMALGISSEIVLMYGARADNAPRVAARQAMRWLQGIRKHPLAWIIEADGELVGEARLDNLNPTDCRARLAIGLFNDRHLGRGIGRRAIDLLLEDAFGPIGLHRVDLRVLSFNRRAIRCYEACGFVHEGVERQSALIDGIWHDDVIMAILAHEYLARDYFNPA